MSKLYLSRRISILFIVCLCPIIRTAKAIRYFKCTNDVQLFHTTKCTQDCMASEMHLESPGTIQGTSKAITTDTFDYMLSSMKTSTRDVEDDTTLLEIRGSGISERASSVLKTSTPPEGLITTVTQPSNETTQLYEGTPLVSTGSQFNHQQTTATKTTYIAQSTQATEQLQFSAGINDLKTSTEETSTSQSLWTTNANLITTHELTSNKLLITENKVPSEQASTSGKFQSQEITTMKEPIATITGMRTTKHTTYHLSTTKDSPTTEAENTTSKTTTSKATTSEATTSEGDVTTKTTHSSKLIPFSTDTLNLRRNPTSTYIRTMKLKQETSTKEITTMEISSTTGQEIKTTELPFSTMTTPARNNTFTTAPLTIPPFCPTNMIYMDCVCQSTCEYPNRLNSCYMNCTGGEACICPDGFYLMEGNCVAAEECSCYYADGGVIIQEGDTQLFNVCTRQCSCLSGVLTCNDFQCNSNAACNNESGILQCHCNQGYHGDGLTCTRLTDCEDVYDAGLVDEDVYTILPMNWNGSAFEVYCKNGWTVFQRREDGSVDFDLTWTDYKEGFGHPRHEMWLGLEKLHYLTYQGIYRLKISIVSDGIPYEMNYSRFAIDSAGTNYILKELGTYSGNEGLDVLAYHHTFQFSTRDRDNDNHPTVNCAENAKGGWWYKQCYKISLNGPYGSPVLPGICYIESTVRHCNIPFTEMSIKLL